MVLRFGKYPPCTKDNFGRISPIKLRREYVDNMEYVDGKLSRINTPYGYYNAADSLFYAYQTDRQGNIRVVYTARDNENWQEVWDDNPDDNPKAFYSVVQSTSYYPYGMPIASGTGAGKTPYKFGGKEYETRFGLNLYDFVARGYDPALGIFLRPDPKAPDFTQFNPYLYCAANPLAYIDPTGESISFYGSIEDLQRVIKILNDANKELEFGLDTSNHNSTNIATLTYTERNPGTELSLGSQAYKQMIDDKRDVKINVESGTQVRIGDGLTGTIDIGDIEMLGNDDPYLNAYGAISHELREQYYYQNPKISADIYDPQDRLNVIHFKYGVGFEQIINDIDFASHDNTKNSFINYIIPHSDLLKNPNGPYDGFKYEIIFDNNFNVKNVIKRSVSINKSEMYIYKGSK